MRRLRSLLFLLLLVTQAPQISGASSSVHLKSGTQNPHAAPTLDDETPPPPEPPYPGSEQGAFASDPSDDGSFNGSVGPSTHPSNDPSTTKAIANPTAQVPPSQVERPLKIDEDGNYIFKKDTVEVHRMTNDPTVTSPKGVNSEGDFVYDSQLKPPVPSARPEIEQPVLTTTSGEYHYKVEETKIHAAASIRVGILTPPSITNHDNGFSFTQLYGPDQKPVLFTDYEWRLLTGMGRLSAKFGSGLMYANGPGRFRNPQRAEEIPEERFNFLLFPNQITAIYKFQYSDNQIVVPFIEGGGGYFLIAEVRDDFKKQRFAGVPVGVAAGGLNFLLNRLDPIAIRQLEAEYGINHVWLTTEARGIVSGSDVNVSSTSFNAGFLMEF